MSDNYKKLIPCRSCKKRIPIITPQDRSAMPNIRYMFVNELTDEKVRVFVQYVMRYHRRNRFQSLEPKIEERTNGFFIQRRMNRFKSFRWMCFCSERCETFYTLREM
jgi:hypothetical protein